MSNWLISDPDVSDVQSVVVFVALFHSVHVLLCLCFGLFGQNRVKCVFTFLFCVFNLGRPLITCCRICPADVSSAHLHCDVSEQQRQLKVLVCVTDRCHRRFAFYGCVDILNVSRRR